MSTWVYQHRLALAQAFRRLFGSPLGTLLSVLATGIALALPTAGYLALSNLQQLTRHSAPAPQVSLFLGVETTRKAAIDIGQRLESHPAIQSHTFLPREQTLARMKGTEGLDEVIGALVQNPFPDAYTVVPVSTSPEAIEMLAEELRTWPDVEHVQLDSVWARRLAALLQLGRTGLALLAILLGTGLVAITFNTIRLQLLTQRAEIEVSRLLGATDAFIRRPYYYFGAIQGLGLAAWLIVTLAELRLRDSVNQVGRFYAADFDLASLGGIEAFCLLSASVVLGIIGAALSLQQHLQQLRKPT